MWYIIDAGGYYLIVSVQKNFSYDAVVDGPFDYFIDAETALAKLDPTAILVL